MKRDNNIWLSIPVYHLAIVFLGWLGTWAAQGQIIYLSDNRSVSAAVAFDADRLSTQGYEVLSHSGYSASVAPLSPFADFSTYQSGSANISYAIASANFTNTSTDTVGAGQTSLLNGDGIFYSSSMFEAGDRHHYPDLLIESSYLQVTFMVLSEVTYSLTCHRGPDPLFSSENWTLSSANLGVLVSTPSLNDLNNGYGPVVSYSGLLVPGDIYTLTLQETGGLAGVPNGEVGVMQVILAVPEPSVGWLLGVGLCGLVAFRFKHFPRQLAKVVSRVERKL